MGIIEEVRHNDLGLPEDFWKHAYAARREGLLAMKVLLNHVAERLEHQSRLEQERSERRQRRGDISIDF